VSAFVYHYITVPYIHLAEEEVHWCLADCEDSKLGSKH